VSTHVDDFDTLVAEREQEAERAGVMLRAAAENMSTPSSGGYAAQALRVRGAAILASTAASELLALAGAYELAAQVSESGMLDEEETRP
jgi:hypothetical protein